MKKIYIAFVFFHIWLCADFASAQLIINDNQTPAQLAGAITGKGIQILNPAITCGANSYGIYNANGTNLGSNEGVILTTGSALNAVGPNDTQQKSTEVGTSGSSLLDQVTGATTYDACMFEFDVIAQGDNLKFNFVFASEEYDEWVGAAYNDVFGFFISGPGITGEQNIALVPGTSTAVGINTVNSSTNQQHFKKNNNGNDIQYDGFTKNLYAVAAVAPCQTYHIRLVIADASDRKWDSGIFIEEIESNNVKLSSSTAGAIAEMIEGCNFGSVTFTRDSVTDQALVVEYFIAGTATNGTDYPQVGTTTTPMTAQYITIPANQASASIDFEPSADGFSDDNEYVTVYLSNAACSGQIMDSIKVYIRDSLTAGVTPATDTICIGGSVQLLGTGGSAFNWSPGGTLNDSTITNPVATPLQTTTYTLTTTASNCSATASAIINVSDINLSFAVSNISCFGANNGSIDLTVVNGFKEYTYLWIGPNSFSATTEDISNLAPGTYTVTVTDSKGCTKTGSVSVTQPSEMVLNTNTTKTSNCSSQNGKASVFPSGGTGPYTYMWSEGSNQQHQHGLGEGTYSVVVTDANGCTKTASVTVESNTNGVKIDGTITSTNVSCYGGSDGTATIDATGPPQGSMSYLWSNGATTKTVTGLSEGFYTVTVTTANGCAKTFTVYISQPDAIVLAKSQVNVLCYGDATGSGTVAPSGGTSPYTYSWSTNPVQTNSTAINLTAGAYIVTVTDAGGCTQTTSFTITQPMMPLTAAISSQQNVMCKGNSTGSATVNASGGASGYSYSWSTNPVQTTQTATNLSTGTYTVTVIDANNCTVTLSVTITEPSQALTGTISKTDISCNGKKDGSATVTPSGGVSPYTYTWNSAPAQFNATATNLAAGTYTVTVKDANNCTIAFSATLNEPAPLAVSISKTDITCKGQASGSATSSVSGGTTAYAYTWSTNPVQTTATASNLSAGNYTVTVTDARNCTATASVTINQPAAALSVSISSVTDVLCKGDSTGSAIVSASGGGGGYAYSWSTTPSQTNDTTTVLKAGTYTVTVTDANNCAVSVSATVNEPAVALGGSITSQNNVSCYGGNDGSATVEGSGGSGSYSYSWNTSPVQTGTTATGLAAGTYQAFVYDNNGCTTPYIIDVTITQPDSLSASFILSNYSGFNISCNGFNDGSIDLTAAGGLAPYTYKWSGPNNYSSTSEDITGVYAGTYSVTIKDASNCTDTFNVTLTEPSPISFDYTMNPATCSNNDGSITISIIAVGAYNYSWTGPNGFTATTKNIDNLAPGIYTITISNSTTCTKKSIEVTRPGDMVLTYSETHISCFGGNDGKINTTVTGGTAPYTYEWTGPNSFTASTKNINNLYAGTYYITVTDASGCNVSATITLTQPDAIVATLTPSVYAGGYNISCNGGSDGAVTVSVTGGIAPYTYTWTGPNTFTSTSKDISGVKAGTYQLTVKDNNNCSKVYSIILTEPQLLTASVSAPTVAGGYHIACKDGKTGSITTSASGGTTSYLYAWTGPNSFTATTPNINNLYAGTYNLTVTDANNCTATASITLTEPNELTAAINSPTFNGGYNIACYGTATGSIDAAVSGGTIAYSYSWIGPNGFTSSSEDLTGLYAGTYELDVTDANGCTTTASITLTQPAEFTANAVSPVITGGYNIGCNGDATASIDLTTVGGEPALSYSWSGPNAFTASTEDISGLFAGTYKVTITDTNGCTAADSVAVTEPGQLNISLNSPATNGYNITCNGANDASVTLSIYDGVPGYSISWTGPNGFTSSAQNLTNLSPGAYDVTVTDTNNCSASASITITEPAALTQSYTLSSYNGGYNVSCNGAADGAVDLSVSGGVTPYTYFWSNNQTTQDIDSIGAGSYSVIIKDANNCSISTTATLTEPDIISASMIISQYNGGYNISCNGATDGAVSLTVSGGTSPYIYSWSGNSFSSTNKDIAGIGAGTYAVTITDANGCTYSGSASLTEPPVLSAGLTTSSYMGGYNITCNGLNDGTIESIANGGTAGYSYSWSGPNGFTSNKQNIDSLFAGSYTLALTDTNGCITTASVTLEEPDTVALSATANIYNGFNISCAGSNDGAIDLTVQGGAAPYSFFWIGPDAFLDTTQNIDTLIAGDYYAYVSDANSCGAELYVTLTEPDSLTSTLTSSIFPGGDNLGCYQSADGSISIISSGGSSPYSYSWSGPGSFSPSSDTITGLSAGTYYVTTADANNCTRADSIILTEPQELNVSLASPEYNSFNISCYGDSTAEISAAVTGGHSGYTYSWTGNNFSSAEQNVSQLPTGNYNITVTDTNGCTSSAAITLTQPAAPVSDTIAITPLTCNGNDGALSLTASGGVPGYFVNWRGPDGYISDSATISNLTAGMYNVTLTDANGCIANDSTTLTGPDALQTSLVASLYEGGYNVACRDAQNGSVDLTVTSGKSPYTYSWSTGATTEDIDSLSAGTYTVTITDANNCIIVDTVALTQPNLITAALTAAEYNGHNISCNKVTDGSIDLTVSGGVPPYTFLWSNYETTEDISNIGADDYSVRIWDANNCEAIAYTTITEPAPVTLDSKVTSASCVGVNNGIIDMIPSGGVEPYDYVWSDGSTTKYVTGLAAGNYTVTVADANNCTRQMSITVDTEYALSSTHEAAAVKCYGGSDGAISISVSEGTTPYSFIWNDGALTQNRSNLPAGTYAVNITDNNGCTTSETITITENELLTATAYTPVYSGSYNLSNYKSGDGSIDLTITGGTIPYAYAWSNGAAEEDLTQLTAGSYSVVVTDAEGCTATAQIILTEPLPLAMPSGISPNGDGNNDYFVVHGIETYPDNDIMIFNRWGNEVFSQRGYNNTWNGRNLKGEELPNGTYFVILSLNTSEGEGEKIMKGYIDLRR